MAKKPQTVTVEVVDPFMFEGERIAPAKGNKKPQTVTLAVADAKSLVRRGKVRLSSGSQSVESEREGADGQGSGSGS